MELRVLEDSSVCEDEYLEYLNLVFPNWGDTSTYTWVFDSDFGAGRADRILALVDNEVIGGTGISYRNICDSNGNLAKIGIMTGSWTLPAARGKGCFSKLVLAMKDQATKKGCVLLTAFAFKDLSLIHI